MGLRVFFRMRALNFQKENFLCGRKGLWTWTWSLTWTWSSNYSPWVSCFSLFVEKNCGLGLLLGAVLQLTRPTRAHGSFWLFKVSSLKIWSGISEPSQSQLTKKTNKPGNQRASRVTLARALTTLNVASAQLVDGKQVNSQIELFWWKNSFTWLSESVNMFCTAGKL